MIFCFS